MNRHDLGTRLLMAVLTLMILAYFAVQAYRYFSDPFSTTLAYAYAVEEGFEVSGVVIRDERALSGEESPFLRLRRSEGERVSRGGVVAVVYQDQASLDMRTELDALSARLEQLRYARDTALGVESAARLDTQIFDSLLRYRSALEENRLDRAEDQGDALRSLVLKRDYTHTDPGSLNEEIAVLEARIALLESQSAQVVRSITAPVSGLYSAVADGYEDTLTPEKLDTLTLSELSALESDEPAGSALGKLVLGDSWYYAASLSTAELKEVRRRSDAGAAIQLRFAKSGTARDYPVTLQSASAPEGGRVLAVFRSDRYLPEVTLLRRQKAQVIFGTVEGLRVPREALRLLAKEDKTASDTMEEAPEASSAQDIQAEVPPLAPQSPGLYCVVGTEARFKPVEVLYTGETFLLVASAPVREELRLRVGDEVIVQAENLYDGKVVPAAG